MHYYYFLNNYSLSGLRAHRATLYCARSIKKLIMKNKK